MSRNASDPVSGFSSLKNRADDAAGRAVLVAGDSVERDLLERYIRNRSTNVVAFEGLDAALSHTASADVVVLRLNDSTGAAPVGA